MKVAKKEPPVGRIKVMAEWLTPTNIMFILGILGMIFTAVNYFRNPQEALDKRQAVDQITTDGKAEILAKQLSWIQEGMDRRFKDMQDSFQALLLQSNNHIHTVDTKVEALNTSVASMGIEIARLATIIEERIPKK